MNRFPTLLLSARPAPQAVTFRRTTTSFRTSLATRTYASASAPASAEILSAPKGNDAGVNVKISGIVEQISKLSLLETADLVKELKTRLNIQDVAMPAMSAAPAAGAAGPAAAAAPKEEEKVAEKAEFTVKLEKIDATAKAKVIREIKGLIPGLNLVEAKKFVEGVPKVVKENVSKEEAETLKKALEAVGGHVVLE